MPVLVKDYSWSQTNEVVVIQVPLKGVHYSKADVFTFENYIKVHYAPFLFEVFLYAQIKNNDSKCALTEKEIVFDLYKEEHGIWETLEANLNKEEKKGLRQQIIAKSQEKAKEEKEAKDIRKQECKRAAVREQLALDTKERDFIEKIKDDERKLASKEIEEWKNEESAVINEDIGVKPKIIDVTSLQASEGQQKIGNTTAEKSQKNELQSKTAENQDIFSEVFKEKKCDPIPVPFPRETGCINVSFTPRAFPTPCRESMHAEEEEWLKKQAEARRACGFLAEDLKPEEQNPIWLKDKGDTFFEMGNYLGAISAYSHAIKIGSKLPSIFSNRAAAHLAIGNYYKALDDTTTALELLTPCVPMNAKSRAKCLVRRATALCHLGSSENALKDLVDAQSLAPDSDLKEDIDQIRAHIAANSLIDT